MGRTPKAWWWEDRGGWYTTISGKREMLAKGKAAKKEAERRLHQLLAADRVAAPTESGPTLDWIAYRFLDAVERDKAPLTFEYYRRHLKPLCDRHGATAAVDIKPAHVEDWLATTTWGSTTRAGAITSVKRLYRWAYKRGDIKMNPLADMEKPRARTRDAILTPEQFGEVLKVARERSWRDFLVALWETGCRPREVATVTAADVDLVAGTWTVVNKTRHATTPTRTIHLTPAMVEMSRRLVETRPAGPLFVNRLGNPWTRNATACRFAQIRKKLGYGPEATAYSLRHLYATDALDRGVPIATVAELMGHRDTAMISKVYSKLRDRSGHLRDAAATIRPGSVTPSGDRNGPAPEPEAPASASTASDPAPPARPPRAPRKKRGSPRGGRG
jgi:integrase